MAEDLTSTVQDHEKRILGNPDFKKRYAIARSIGSGSFGTVYLATQLSTGQKVAIKILNLENAAQADIQHFRRELQICAELHHPHIVRLIDSGQHDEGLFYIVFEYVPGLNLADVLKVEGVLTPTDALRLMAEIADALSYAHEEHRVVHRDLTPRNIMVLEGGARRNAKLLDFGLGALEGARDELRSVTRAGDILGTPAYAAPEQLRGRPVDDGRAPDDPTRYSADLYSWALILAECLTGKRVFDGTQIAQVISQQVAAEPISLPPGLAGTPIAPLLERCWEKDPVKRRVTARSLVRSLEQIDPEEIPDVRKSLNKAPEQLPESASRSARTLGSLWRELRNRRVVRTAVAYGVVAWPLLQAIDYFFDSQVLNAYSLAAVIAGFPVMLVLSWLYQLTVHGPVREPAGTFSEETAAPWLGRLLLVVLVGVTGALAYSVASRFDTEARTIRIAVLPFDYLGDDRTHDYLSYAIAEDIQTLLKNRFPGLKLVSWRASSRFVPSDNPVDIGRKLNAEFLVGGSIQPDTDRLRIRARLVNPALVEDLWAKSYDQDFEQLLGMQRNVAQQIVRALGLELPVGSTMLGEEVSINNEAFLLYLKARDLLRSRRARAIDAAAELFADAARLDPSFSRARAGLCEAGVARYRISQAQPDLNRAKRDCQDLAEQGDENEAAHKALGEIYLTAGDYASAETEFRASVEIQPDADAYIGLAEALANQKRTREAEVAFERSILEDPGYFRTYGRLGGFLASHGRYKEAARQFELAVSHSPDSDPIALINLGVVQFRADDWPAAEASWAEANARQENAFVYLNLGNLRHHQARFGEAAGLYRKAIDLAPHQHPTWGALAVSLRFFGGAQSDMRAALSRATDLVEARLESNPNDALELAQAAFYYALGGDGDSSTQVLARALAQSSSGPQVLYFASAANTLLDRQDEALRLVGDAIANGYSRRLVRTDPLFEVFRRDERFLRLVADSESSIQRVDSGVNEEEGSGQTN